MIAPERYWKPKQILKDCDNRRNAYYDGFQDGVAAALQQPDTHHLKMWSSCECPLPTCEPCCPEQVPCSPCLSPNFGMQIHSDIESQGMIEPIDEDVPAIDFEPETQAPASQTSPIDSDLTTAAPAVQQPDAFVGSKPTRLGLPKFPVAAASNKVPVVQSASALRDIGFVEAEANEADESNAQPKSAAAASKNDSVPQAGPSKPTMAKTTALKVETKGSLIRVAAPIHAEDTNNSFIKYASELQMDSAD